MSPGGAAQALRVFIENEAGSFVKHIHNEKTLTLLGTSHVSRAFPFPYGFVLNTSAEDGDNVDCFILTKRHLETGQIVDCDPIALMEQVEDGEVDHKVLVLIPGEPEVLDECIQQKLIDFARHVFEHIPGKTMQVGGFQSKDVALDYVQRHQDPGT
ncbi:MAG TPA: inorganic diphosphatase [Candidatus Angelobacter sp.]|nr:inorganic diphosphatase [Candidatus Angelobacter sp.]